MSTAPKVPRFAVRAAVLARVLAAAVLLGGALPNVAVPDPTLAQSAPAPGAVVGLQGTPHIWVADFTGVLHWAGDTRALADKQVNWSDRRDVPLGSLLSFRRGDPWLSAGLYKEGTSIYLVKWEASESLPTLLHIQSIADVELFGINGSNYGQFVLESHEWQRRYGINAASLPRGTLAPAAAGSSGSPPASPSAPPSSPPSAPAPPSGGDVLLADDFNNPSSSTLPRSSPNPAHFSVGVENGEYVIREHDSTQPATPYVLVPGSFPNATLAIDVRLSGGTDRRLIELGCRRSGSSYYFLIVSPNGAFAVVRIASGSGAILVPARQHSAIRQGEHKNRFELTCDGSTIAARANGAELARVSDSTLTSGAFYISAYGVGEPRVTTTGHFDNLVVTRGGASRTNVAGTSGATHALVLSPVSGIFDTVVAAAARRGGLLSLGGWEPRLSWS